MCRHTYDPILNYFNKNWDIVARSVQLYVMLRCDIKWDNIFIKEIFTKLYTLFDSNRKSHVVVVTSFRTGHVVLINKWYVINISFMNMLSHFIVNKSKCIWSLICWLWTLIVMVIPERCRDHYIRYMCFLPLRSKFSTCFFMLPRGISNFFLRKLVCWVWNKCVLC
jgi:hypothetical protein